MSEEKKEGAQAAAPQDVGAAADAAPAQPAAKKAKEPVSVSRRSLLIGVGGTAALLGLGALRYAGHVPLNRPPGGQDEAHLVSACIRCEKCYEACPRHVIKPAKIEDGLLGMRSPQLDFSADYCDFCAEENGGVPLCVASCPTEALKPGSTPETGVLGLAELNQVLCLAYRLIGCRFCYDACEYEAMALDENNRPYVLNDACNGCGACESVCVSLQNGSISAGATERAIVVRPLEA